MLPQRNKRILFDLGLVAASPEKEDSNSAIEAAAAKRAKAAAAPPAAPPVARKQPLRKNRGKQPIRQGDEGLAAQPASKKARREEPARTDLHQLVGAPRLLPRHPHAQPTL